MRMRLTRLQLERLEARELPSTYYVANSGSDNNNGSSTAPWLTLQHSADVIHGGDTVIVRAGTYVGFEMTTSGSAAARITFRAEPGTLVNAKSSQTPSSAGAINLEGASYVTIDGFTVILATYGATRANIRAVTDTDVVIRNNTIDNASDWGILTGFSENVLIENNRITNTHNQHGIYVGNSADNPIVRGNTVINSHTCGIQLNSDVSQGGDGIITGAILENNILLGNAYAEGASINFDGVQNSIIRNNVIHGAARNGIALYQIDGAQGAKNNWIIGNTIVFDAGQGYYAISIASDADPCSGNKIFDNVLYKSATSERGSITIDSTALTGFQSDYNVVVDRFNLDPFGESQPLTLAQWRTQTGQDLHSIIATPDQLFVDPTNLDFHLKTGSPAIDAGTNLVNLPTDLTGAARPNGASTDIGAYEYIGSGGSQPAVTGPAINAAIAGTIGTSNLSTGLVAAFNFNEGAGNTVASTVGSPTGTTAGTTWTTGRFGSAVAFDGPSKMATMTDTAVSDLTTSMTMEPWANPIIVDSWSGIVLKEGATGLADGP